MILKIAEIKGRFSDLVFSSISLSIRNVNCVLRINLIVPKIPERGGIGLFITLVHKVS